MDNIYERFNNVAKNPDPSSYNNLKDGKDIQGNGLLHHAAMVGNTDLIDKMVNQDGYSINSQNDLGETPLHKAYEAGNEKAVQHLVNCGANTSIRSGSRETPEMYARRHP